MKLLLVGCLASAALSLMSATASAQALSSSIAGVVKDTTGAVLPGVTVEAASPALIEKVRTAVTDGQGQYKIIDLRPGLYTVTFTLTGFGSVKRDGIELRSNFTAPVNADLQVGSLAETVTVSGASPVVDVQNVTQQTTLSRTVVDSMPVAKSILGYAGVMPAVITPPDAQDVGGAKGEFSVRLALHGGKQGDQKLMLDGMRYNSLASGGTGRSFYPNPASSQEILVELAAGGSAEFDTGGVHVDVVPKDGANTFSEYFFGSYTGDKLQSDNLTETLRGRGMDRAGGTKAVFDVNGAVGGPIRQDRLWFYSGHRVWGNVNPVPNIYVDSVLNDLFFQPDMSRPIDAKEMRRSNNLRLTAQVARKHKVTFFSDIQNSCECQRGITGGGLALEATPRYENHPLGVIQGTWTYPATSRLLFSAGVGYSLYHLHTNRQPGITEDAISVLEQTTSFRYGSVASYGDLINHTENDRFSMSYVTGSHNVKVGMFSLYGPNRNITSRGTSAVQYTFRNGKPISLTQYNSPTDVRTIVNPEMAFFGQDQWTIKKLTVNLGLRYEYLRAYVPASHNPATRFIPERDFAEVDCVPCWHDFAPRLGVAYDIFGNGKTAIKGSLGRYTAAETVTLANLFNPVNSTINNVNRTWTDPNGNFIVDCDLTVPVANGADNCGQINNLNFGKQNVTLTADPDVLTGWGKRGFNWQASAAIEHALTPRVAVSAGYYRTWYGNFTVIDNLNVTPADYTEYCVAAPVDTRLPGGGGSEMCGFYALTPEAFSRVPNNVLTFASKFGKQTEVYNGVDVGFVARLSDGGRISGGVSIGNSVGTSTGLGVTSSHTNQCFVVDSPQGAYYLPTTTSAFQSSAGASFACESSPPYQPRVKLLVVYPLPWAGIQASANFQTLPGAPITASYSATAAEIQKTLGRPLPGSSSTATVELIPPFSEFESRINQVDIRLAKIFKVRKGEVRANFDAYNLINAGPILSQNVTYGPSWLKPNEILSGRLLKFSVQLEF